MLLCFLIVFCWSKRVIICITLRIMRQTDISSLLTDFSFINFMDYAGCTTGVFRDDAKGDPRLEMTQRNLLTHTVSHASGGQNPHHVALSAADNLRPLQNRRSSFWRQAALFNFPRYPALCRDAAALQRSSARASIYLPPDAVLPGRGWGQNYK